MPGRTLRARIADMTGLKAAPERSICTGVVGADGTEATRAESALERTVQKSLRSVIVADPGSRARSRLMDGRSMAGRASRVRDCGSNGVSGPIAPGVMARRERCRDDRDICFSFLALALLTW
jgi:hypothetical protein